MQIVKMLKSATIKFHGIKQDESRIEKSSWLLTRTRRTLLHVCHLPLWMGY